jgi:hypothetical protein
MREVAEQRRIKELKKKAQEDAEEEERQRVWPCLSDASRSCLALTYTAPPLDCQVAREMFMKDKELAEEKAQKERQMRVEAQRREEERIRKNEEHRLQTQKASWAQGCCCVHDRRRLT